MLRSLGPVAYDEDLASEIRALLGGERGVREMRMFGGLAFLVDGNMAVAAASEGRLMVRVDPATTAGLLAEPGAGPMVMRGRELDGWLLVEPPAGALSTWVTRGVSYARSLPPKKKK